MRSDAPTSRRSSMVTTSSTPRCGTCSAPTARTSTRRRSARGIGRPSRRYCRPGCGCAGWRSPGRRRHRRTRSAAIRAAVSAGGAVDVVAHLASDAHAARLLRAAAAPRRGRADPVTRRAARQRAPPRRRRRAEGPHRPRPRRATRHRRRLAAHICHRRARPTHSRLRRRPDFLPLPNPPTRSVHRTRRSRRRGPAAPVVVALPRRPAGPRCCGSTRTPCGCNAGPTTPVGGWCTPSTPTAGRS